MTAVSLRVRRLWANAWVALPGLAALLTGWGVVSREGGSLLEGVVRASASALLMVVAASLAHVVVEHRRYERHASIRAEIAAGGGLTRRLMV